MSIRVITLASPVLAALFVVTGMAILGLIDNLIPMITEDIGLWQFQALRSVVGLPVLVCVAVILGRRVVPRSFRAVALRSLLTGSGLLVYFACLAFLPIGQVAAGLFTAPVFVILISRFGLGEPIGAWRLGAVGLGFFGILLVLRPGLGAGSGWLSAAPVLSGALYGAGAVVTRRLCGQETMETLLAGFFGVLGLWGVLGLILLPAGGEGWIASGWSGSPGGAVWAVIVVQALGSLIAVGMVIRGYLTGDPAHMAVCEYSLLIFAALWAFALRGETVDALELAGMACIIGAGVVITLRKEPAT
jgi:drug/metabolite transporter (DMT)-like permease